MSTELDQAREIAERIARRVSGSNPPRPERAQPKAEVSAELAAVRAGLSELQRKIAQLEAKVSSEPTEWSGERTDFSYDSPSRIDPRTPPTDARIQAFDQHARPVPLTHSPWLAGVNATISHPSQEKFGVEEAVVSELVDYFEKGKTCSVEPGGKPCDHCAMCSSRGF
ncbi:MAG TPA: hypothetical protein DHU55_07280 [Blastocatellia bacterium]|jgi:hypothetical protein|nr:hypothetical protein [Blastocatellia bacterium]HAF23761.1 hypothetical protein [Blastocatellia bacterium]HCX29561.1 hypothetical protein [Blastocatellia bacterium]